MTVKKIIPAIFYFILIAYIFQFRYKLDKFGPYFTSDGAVKIYQTFQYKEKGIFELECFYPGKSFDPDFHFYPISYPWAIFNSAISKQKCVLEYPPFFYWLGALLLNILPLSLLLYLPIFFYSLSIFLFDRILLEIGFESLFRVYIVVLSFFSFPLLTALDYTESPFFILIYLSAFYIFVRWLNDSSRKHWYLPFLFGFTIGLSFFIRLEILIPFAMVMFFYLAIFKDFRSFLLISAGFGIITSVFFIYNYLVSGHILGFRYVSSIDLNENSSADLFSRLRLLKAYLWGDHIMVGILQFNPLCFLILFISSYAFLFRKLGKEGFIFLLSGLASIISIPFYVTFYGGVGYFGLRYLEAPFFILIIGFSYAFVKLNLERMRIARIALFVILGIIFYLNLVTTREGLKVLRSSSADLNTLHLEIEKSSRFVIHTSLYSSIWMGKSFLNRIHVLTANDEDFENYLKKLDKNEIFSVIQSPRDIYISSDIPRKLFYKYKTEVEIDQKLVERISEKDLFGVKLFLLKKR